jgi:tetratricopeptide (TPR) repeat protein
MSAQLNTDKILTIGRNALYFEDYVLSIQYFNQVIRVKPYLSEPYMFRSIAKIQLGDYEGAEADGSEAIERNPFVPEAFYARGFSRMKIGKYEEAYKDFSKALEFSPNSQHLLLSRMDASDRAGKPKEALRDIQSLIRLFPGNSNYYYEKGRICLSLKDTTEAENSFNALIKNDSLNYIGWSARALLKMQKNDKTGAFQDLNAAIKNKSKYFGDYLNRGILHVENKKFLDALQDYDQAIKMEPKSILGWINRAILRSDLGDNNNSLSDFKEVLKLDSSLMEARYSKAILEIKLRNYRDAIQDLKIVLNKHPYFLPAYWGIAEAYSNMNNIKEAFRYRQKAADLEKNKDEIRKKNKESLEAKARIADIAPVGNSRKKTDLFNRFATVQNEDEKGSGYQDEKRGAVQNKIVDVINEKNFVLSYYSKPDDIRQTNLFHPVIDSYNKSGKLKSKLKITCNEIPLTSELINRHFENINDASSKLMTNTNDADLYFARALEFALVQDFLSAIEDLNKAISIRSDFTLAYFTRANLRYKYIDYLKNMEKEHLQDAKNKIISSENQYKYDIEMVLRDFDKVNELNPDFSFGYFNKANILGIGKDFNAAIELYSIAIKKEPDFAEAYFNRGLTYLFIGEDAKGLSDLSKAGELGIYGAYNLIQRFK